jgi:hypothetical protein
MENEEKTEQFAVTCRTYGESGEYVNSVEVYVDVPESVCKGEGGDLMEYLTSAVSDEMDERCDPADGEAYWEVDEWYLVDDL